MSYRKLKWEQANNGITAKKIAKEKLINREKFMAGNPDCFTGSPAVLQACLGLPGSIFLYAQTFRLLIIRAKGRGEHSGTKPENSYRECSEINWRFTGLFRFIALTRPAGLYCKLLYRMYKINNGNYAHPAHYQYHQPAGQLHP